MKQWREPFVRFSKLWNKCRVRLLQMDQFLFYLKIRIGDKKKLTKFSCGKNRVIEFCKPNPNFMDLGSLVIGRKLSDIYANFRTVLGGILVHSKFPRPHPPESDGFVFVTATLSFLTLKEVVIRLTDSR